MFRALRLRRLAFLAFLVLGALLAGRGLSPADGLPSEEAPPEPVPLRRVLLAPERLAGEMERVRQGLLVQLPRQEFEDRLKNATHAGQALKHPPRLVEARYQRVRLRDSALIGSAEWKVHNPSPMPGLLHVQPLGLALRQMRWSDGKSVLLGELDGKELDLFVETPGEQSLFLEWSARGNPVSGGLRFSLDLPPCAVAALELELPRELAVALSRDAGLLTGPHPAEAPDHQTWRIAFAGRNQLNFEVRRTRGPDLPKPLVLASVAAVDELTPGQVQADFDFAVTVLHDSIRELRCECSPGLRPYEVNVRNLEGWKTQPGPNPNAPSLLTIRLREPFEGGSLQVRSLAPLASEQLWVSPSVRLLDSVPRGETLELRIGPELRMENWKPGGFRLLRSTFAADGKQVLNLTLGQEGTTSERPGARFSLAGSEYRTRQRTWWQLVPDRPLLTTKITYEVVRGRLFRLPVQLPAGWEVEQVDMVPADLLRHWSVPDRNKALMLVDLDRPLEPSAAARLIVRLRAAQPLAMPRTGASLPFPDVVPQDARLREGALAISVAPLYRAHVRTEAAAAAPETTDSGDGDSPKPATGPRPRPLWGKQVPDFYYVFKGPPLDGTVQLRPRSGQLRARCTSDVVLASARARVLVRLELHPEVGAPESVDLFIAGPAVGRWEWQTVRGTNTVKRIERLPARELAATLALLGANGPLSAVTSLSVPPRGSWWRLTFARPLTEALTLESSVELPGEGTAPVPGGCLALLASRHPLGVLALAAATRTTKAEAGERRWEAPLVSVPEAERRDGLVTLHLAGGDLVHVETEGLLEVGDAARDLSAAARPGAPLPAASWRTFRYGPPPLGLTLHGQAPAADRSAEAVVDRAALTSTLGEDGRLLHLYRFQVWNWRQQTLPLRLPAGVQLLAARSDGRALDRLPLADDGQLVELPVTGAALLHRFEVLYATDIPAWRFWTRLEASAPGLPVRPLTFRRTWALPAGVAPLASGSVHALPGSHGPSSLPILTADTADDHSAKQEQQLTDALARLRKQYRPGESWPLGQLLDALVYDDFKDAVPLVLDVWALGEAGVTTATRLPLSADVWRGDAGLPLGGDLVFVPCRSALLLTTRSQVRAAQAAAGEGRPPFAACEGCITEGFVFGHDGSGRFRRVDDWLEDEGGQPVAGAAGRLRDRVGTDGTEWEALAGADDGTLRVVRRRDVPLFGLALAGLLAGLALRVCRSGTERHARRLLLAWLTLGGLALFWLPPVLRDLAWWPALIGVCAALLWTARLARGRVVAPRPGITIAGVLAFFGMMAVTGEAAAPGPATVFLVADPDNADKATVLAPPDLLDQLQTLAKRGAAGLHGPVLLSAAYDGKADGQNAYLEGRFHVHAFSDEPALLTLPLGTVPLTEALLDGAAVQPVVVRQPREGYAVEVKGRGSHTLLVRFTVALAGTGEERDLRFPIPELPQSRLLLEAPAGSVYLHAAEARGWQHTSTETKVVRLEADLGSTNSARVRWRRDGRQPAPATVSVQEAYYWDLQASTARLLAILQYRVTKGWETTFKLDLPRELEVLSVEAGPLPNGPPAPRLRWLVREDGGNRRLCLEFQGPVTGGAQVTLELVPRQPFTRTVVLPFPTPLDAQLGQGFLAYRTEGVEVSVANHHAITGIEREQLAKSFTDSFAQPWRTARLEELPAPARAFSRGKGGVLHLILRPPPSPVRAQQEIAWQVGLRQATLHASARLTAADNALSFIEWELPEGLALTDVTGPNVRSWSRSGPRVQVWLQKPVGETTLQLDGWLPLGPKVPARFSPCLRFEARSLATTLRVTPGSGVVLTPGALAQLSPRPDLRSSDRELAYTSDQDNYNAQITVAPAAIRAACRLLTFAEVRSEQLTFVASLDCRVTSGELRSLMVNVRNWDGKELRLDAPGATRRREQLHGPGGSTWLLDLPAGVKDRYQLTLTGSLPLSNVTELPMPEVRVETTDTDAPVLERWLAVAGPDLAAEDGPGLALAADGPAALHWWPREAERLRRAGGRVWQVKAEDWRLRLRPRTSRGRPAPLQVFLTEHAAAVPDGERWVHQATFWLYHEAGADLDIRLPDGAEVLAVTLDGASVPPLQPGPDRLWLPLPGSRGGRVVRLTWAFKSMSIKRSILHLSLRGPSLEGVAPGPVVWIVHVPAGYRAVEPRGRTTGVQPGSAAALDLWRAAAELHLLGRLLERTPDADQVRGAQETFERYCRQASYQLGLPGADPGDTGPGGQNLATWLQEMRGQYAELLKAHHLERPRSDHATPAVGPLFPFDLTPFDRGQPHYWQAAADTPPRLELVPRTMHRQRQTWTSTMLLLILILAVWIVAHFFRAAWPEQLALLGGLGALLFGPGLGTAFLLLPLGCLGYRLIELVRWLVRSIRERREAVAADGNIGAAG